MTTLEQKQAIAELWRRGELSWLLHRAQLAIYACIRSLPRNQREALIFCARRFGKSFLGVICALEDCLRTPGVQVAIIGPTLKQTTRIVTPILQKILQSAPEGLVKRSKSESLWQVGQSTLLLCGFDTVLESVRGLDLAAVYIEETGLATPDLDEYTYLLYSVLLPTMMHSRGRMHHLTTPSRIVDHPLHLETLPRTKLAQAFYLYTIEDNPLLSPEDIEQEIATLGGRDSVNARRELFCEIVRDESLVVVPEFAEARHVRPITLPSYYNAWVAADVGGVRDKTWFGKFVYDFERAKVLVAQEAVFGPETSTQDIMAGVQSFGEVQRRYVDAPGQLLTDLRVQHGYLATLPDKAQLDASVAMLRLAFQRDQIEIDPSCQFLIASLRSGTFNRQRTDFLRTATLGHLDAVAGLVYGVRHANKSNPFPLLGQGVSRDTHYVRNADQTESNLRTQQALAKAFGL